VKYSSKAVATMKLALCFVAGAVAISQEDITSSQFDSLGPGKAVFVNLYSNG
jgi:hypothetical protein